MEWHSAYTKKHLQYITPKKNDGRRDYIVRWPRPMWPIRFSRSFNALLYRLIGASK